MRENGEGLRWADSGLMLACAGLAAARPVEILVFAYAVLGPAHYLTQISWLSDRDFDAARRSDGWVLGAFTLALALVGMRPDSPWWGAAVGWGVAAAFVASPMIKSLAAICGGVVAWLLASRGWTLWALLLPSLIHVYAFTALFLWSGARRERTAGALAGAVVHLACGALLLFMIPTGAGLPAFMREPLGFFLPVAGSVLAHLGRSGWPATSGILAFMAFAYLYHYLNWFSKAGFLGWHRVSRARAAALTGAYAFFLALYA